MVANQSVSPIRDIPLGGPEFAWARYLCVLDPARHPGRVRPCLPLPRLVARSAILAVTLGPAAKVKVLQHGDAAFPLADLVKRTEWFTTAPKGQWIRLGARVDPGPKELESFFSCAWFLPGYRPALKTRPKVRFDSVKTSRNECLRRRRGGDAPQGAKEAPRTPWSPGARAYLCAYYSLPD
jgi:hypothetical protein